MKQIVCTVVLLLSLLTAKAEYDGWFLQLSIDKTDGKKTTAHVYVTSAGAAYEDSLQSTAFLLQLLDGFDGKIDSIIQVFKDRIRYVCRPYGGEEDQVIYDLVNEIKIKASSIRKITIREKIYWSYTTSIANKLTMQDTVWLKTKPVRYESTGALLCGYELYFHEYNKELEKLLKQLKIQAEKSTATESEDDDILLEPIIKKIMRYKVIVIVTCTC